MLVSLLMFFWYLYRSHMQPSKPSKTFVFPMNFNDFTLQRNMIFDDFPDLFRYQFWHWFLMSFGIDFGSILGPLCQQIPCFLEIVLLMICWIFFIRSLTKMVTKDIWFVSPFSVLFRILFLHTCNFYQRKTNKCQKPCFPIFFKTIKDGLHTCTFYQSKTYKCGVTVFTILKDKRVTSKT